MINKRLKDVLFTDQWSEVCMERLSPFGYVLVSKWLFHILSTYARSHSGVRARTDESPGFLFFFCGSFFCPSDGWTE